MVYAIIGCHLVSLQKLRPESVELFRKPFILVQLPLIWLRGHVVHDCIQPFLDCWVTELDVAGVEATLSVDQLPSTAYGATVDRIPELEDNGHNVSERILAEIMW